MIPPLDGMRVVEGAAFVAAPSGAMTLAQLGADVIRFDQIGGGPDQHRWPVTAEGRSLYWAGLNKGKRSLAVDVRSDEGREVVQALVATCGTFVTNFPARGWMGYGAMSARRPDLVMVAITGNRDGSTALDYTVNCAVGYPAVTGAAGSTEPVNHVLPAWDLICGQTLAIAVLAADRRRLAAGQGASVQIALSDVALAAVAALGHVAEVQVNGDERPRVGNFIYGAFGAELATSDGVAVYVTAVGPSQWKRLVAATEIRSGVDDLAARSGLDLDGDDGARYLAREELAELVGGWVGARPLAEVAHRFDELGVCWGRYQTFSELVHHDPRCSLDNEMFRALDQPGIGPYLVPGSPMTFDGALPVEPGPAPLLGEHTDQVLADVLGLSGSEIGRLHDDGVVAGPDPVG